MKNDTPNYPYLAGYHEASIRSLIYGAPGIKITNEKKFRAHLSLLVEEANRFAKEYGKHQDDFLGDSSDPRLA
jgi:hypothetical protein